MSNLHKLIQKADVLGLRDALVQGEDPNKIAANGSTPLSTAIEHHNSMAFAMLLQHGSDPERTDQYGHTALRSAVLRDWPYAVAKLLPLGVDRGWCPKYPARDDTQTMSGVQRSIDDMQMPDGMAAIMTEAEWRAMLSESFSSAATQQSRQRIRPVISDAWSQRVLQQLISAGEPLGYAPPQLRRNLIGLPPASAPVGAHNDFAPSQLPGYGTTNPELVSGSTLPALVRSGQSADDIRSHFRASHQLDKPLWCYQRHGHSLTHLPDGRSIGIGGTHKHKAQFDYHIYNDVVVHDGHGNAQVYRYPTAEFAPTDYHSATLVGPYIIIIGNQGHIEQRDVATTPIRVLNLQTMAMRQIQTKGNAPGWISGHNTYLLGDGSTLEVVGGRIWRTGISGIPDFSPNRWRYWLNLQTGEWSTDNGETITNSVHRAQPQTASRTP